MNETVRIEEIEKATKEIVNLSRDLDGVIIVASLSPKNRIDVYYGFGEIQAYAGDTWSDSMDRVIFYEQACAPDGAFSIEDVRESLMEAIIDKGYVIVSRLFSFSR